MSQQTPDSADSQSRDSRSDSRKSAVVGKSEHRLDSVEKVLGRAEYTYDIERKRMLYVETVDSPHAHATIVDISTSDAARMQGVRAVVTGADVPDTRYGAGIYDETVLPTEKVRFVGEPVVVVAAETEEIAQRAADKVSITYEKRPAVFETKNALSDDPPAVVHEDLHDYTMTGADLTELDPDKPNLYANHSIRTGEAQEALERADHVYKDTYQTDPMHHVQMEPHVSVAEWSPNDELTVWTSTNTTYRIKDMLATAFDLSPASVFVNVPYVGGSFGGKEGVTQLIAAAVARHTDGRPVKYAFSRQDQFIEGTYRTPSEVELTIGVTDDKDLIAMELEAYLNGGAYATTGFAVARKCGFAAAGTYDIPNLSFDSYGVYTNLPVSSSFRGFGNSQIILAIESLVEDIAIDQGWDPIAFREQNTMEEGDVNPVGEIMGSNGAKECLKKAAKLIDMHNRPSDETKSNSATHPTDEDDDNWVRGIGLAQGSKYSMAPTGSSAFVKVHQDGTLEVRTSAEEIGTGSMTVLAQITAEEFGVDLENVRVLKGDTEVTPYDGGSISSRLTYNTGNAVRKASLDAKEQILQHAASELNTDPTTLDVTGGRIIDRENNEQLLDIEDLFEETVFGGGGFLREGAEIIGKGTWHTDVRNVDDESAWGDRKLTAFYTHGAQACDLEINTDTGEVQFNRFVTVYDVGRAINPKLVEGQMEGGVSMGIGSALYESMVFDEGRIENPNLLDYKIPFSTEHPLEIETQIVETFDEDGPYGAKGVGEAVLVPTAAAIGNAIRDASGKRLTSIPFTPEDILDAVDGERQS